jgi:hypothetical protein
MILEAGKSYYFLQHGIGSMRSWLEGTKLSCHSRELVLYELNGARYCDWFEGKSGKSSLGKR